MTLSLPMRTCLLLESLQKDQLEAPPGAVSLFRYIFTVVCLSYFLHHRFACEQVMHHEQSSLLMKTFWCWGHAFQLCKELGEFSKIFCQTHHCEFTWQSSFSSSVVSFSLASSLATHSCSISNNYSLFT